MIRLNDIRRTVIDESKVVAYFAYEDEKTYCISIGLNIKLFIDYNSQEARDKDIELLDSLLEAKDIEDKVKNRIYPDSIDAFNYAMSGIKKECKLVSEREYDPVKKEEYITWNSVTEGDVNSVIFGVDVRLRYNSYLKAIVIYKEIDKIVATIYDKSLFKSLELKRVE